jgi:hypothetical protein
VRVLNVLDGPVSFTVAGVHTTFGKDEQLARRILPLF